MKLFAYNNKIPLKIIGKFRTRITVNGIEIIKYFNLLLLVFGITDLDHHFHPTAFMVTSHKTEED